MLITCYQCRQQVDAPDDFAGKRVHCPHCQHVIVVPAKATEGAAQTPALGMPNLELDVAAEKPTTTKVPAQPLPPYEAPAANTGTPPTEELPPIEHVPRRRRAPVGSAAPPSNLRWGGMMTGGVLVFGLLAFCLMRGLTRPEPVVEFPKFAVQVDGPPPLPPGLGMENLLLPGGLKGQVAGDALPWEDFYSAAHRFKVRFPGPVTQKKQLIAGKEMSLFEAKHGDWEFSVGHRELSDEEFNAVPLDKRFQTLHEVVNNDRHVLIQIGGPLKLSGRHPGREWWIRPVGILDGGHYVQTFFVREENGYSHYLLEAKGPAGVQRQDPGFHIFFNSFIALPGIAGDNAHIGQTVYEEIADANNAGRRVNEVTAMALHSHKPIAVVGALSGLGLVLSTDGRILPILGNQRARNGRAIEQLAISADGEKLAIISGGEIQVLSHWEGDGGKEVCHQHALRCVFTKNRQLLVLTLEGIDVRDQATGKQLASKVFPPKTVDPLTLQGLALSSDERTLAVFDEKTIALWQWPEWKLLGQCEAPVGPITAVAFSPDGKTLASAGADRAIRLWDVATRKERATLQQHAWTVAALAFTPDGKRLASGGLDGMLLLWDLEPAVPTLIWAQANRFPVRAVAFDADGKQCYLTCWQASQGNQKEGHEYVRRLRKIAVADMKPNPEQAKKIVAQCAGLHLPAAAATVWIARDGKTIATTSKQLDFFGPVQPGETRIWDGVTGRQRHAMPAPGGCILSPDGKWLAFARPGEQAEVRIMDTATLKVSRVLVRRQSTFLDNIFFTPDSKSLWILDKHELVRYAAFDQDLNAVELQRVKLKEWTDPRSIDIGVALDQKSFLVSVIGVNGGFRKRTLYAMADGEEMPMPKFAPGERSQFLRLRNLDQDGVELDDLLRGNAQVIGRQWQVMSANAIHPNGALAVAEASERDALLKLHFWDLKERRPLLTLPDAGARLALALRFSPGGRFVGCVTSAGWTRITPIDWLLARKDLLRCDPDEAAPP